MLNNVNFQPSLGLQSLSLLNQQTAPEMPTADPLAQMASVAPATTNFSLPDLNSSLSNLGGSNFNSLFGQVSNVVNTGAQKLLKQPPFAPNNINLFTPQTYPNATAMQPAPATQTSTAQLKNMLTDTLMRRSLQTPNAVQTGLNAFNNAQLTQTVPDARLRAGLASLVGTAGQGAIDVIKNGTYGSVSFGQPPSGPNTSAEVVLPPGATKPNIIINERYQYEDPRLLGVLLSHEALHQDTSISNKEELVANSMETMVYGQTLLTNPSLATSGTELSRRMNTKLMARINDRDENGNMRILTSQGNVYPGGNPLPTFATPFPGGGDTAGNAYLQQMLQKVTGQNVPNAGFNDATVNLIDQNQKLFSPAETVGLAAILRLNVLPG